MTTPKALRVSPISAATASAPFWFKSAIATRAPSRAKVAAISLPMPLAAPVTMATLSLRRMSRNSRGGRFQRRLALGGGRLQVVVGDLAEAERDIANEVNRGHDLEHGQLRDRGEGMRRERKRRRSRPRALERDVLEIILDELADSRAAVDVRNDLEQKVRGREQRAHRVEIGGFVLVSHGGGGDADRAVVERADHLIDLDVQRRIGQLFRKAPKLAAARDRRLVVEEHAVAVAALAAAEAHRNDLSGFGIVAEAGGIRHADELVLDEGLVHLERLRDDRAQLVRVRSIRNDHEFSVDETIRARRIGRVRQRHGECPRLDLCFLHAVLLLIGWMSRPRCSLIRGRRRRRRTWRLRSDPSAVAALPDGAACGSRRYIPRSSGRSCWCGKTRSPWTEPHSSSSDRSDARSGRRCDPRRTGEACRPRSRGFRAESFPERWRAPLARIESA